MGGGKIALIIAGSLVGLCCIGGAIAAISGGGKTTKTTSTSGQVVAAPTTPVIAPTTPAAAPTTTKPAPPPTTEAAAPPADDSVTFEVVGAGDAMVSWIDDQFQTGQAADTPLPWRKTFAGSTPGMNFNAQRKSGDNGSITCHILRGGKVIKSNTSSGPYAVVGCALS